MNKQTKFPPISLADAMVAYRDDKGGFHLPDELGDAIISALPRPSAEDVEAWRSAIIWARDDGSEDAENPASERAFWNQQLAAFDRFFRGEA